MKKTLLPLLLLIISSSCIANASSFNVNNETPFLETTESNILTQELGVDTYQKLIDTFSKVYNNTDFTPNICNSYFNKSDLSTMLAVPLVISPGDNFYFEVFGQMYDSQYNYLSQMDRDSMMYGFHYQSAISQKNLSNFAMGFGLSVKLNENVNMKTLYSNKEIPGYGRNNLALGLEVNF